MKGASLTPDAEDKVSLLKTGAIVSPIVNYVELTQSPHAVPSNAFNETI